MVCKETMTCTASLTTRQPRKLARVALFGGQHNLNELKEKR